MGIAATNPARLATAAPSDGEKFAYVYNPWGQLVEIKKIGGGSVTHAKYTYSAMGHRISEQLDTNDSLNSGLGDGVVDADDPKFFIATDPSGRRLATYRGTDSDPKETFIHHDARIRGPVHQGGPILRDRDADLADKPFYWASEPAASDRYERHYYALDYRGYVAAIFAGDGTLVEQVRYSATGVPFNIPLGDVNGDGKVEAGTSGKIDEDQIKTMYTAYHVRGDLDLDGDVDAADLAIAQARDGTGTGRGHLTVNGSDHRVMMPDSEFLGFPLGMHVRTSCRLIVLMSESIVLNAAESPRWIYPFPTSPKPRTPKPYDPLPDCHYSCYRETNELLWQALKPYNELEQGPGQGLDSPCYKAAQAAASKCCTSRCKDGTWNKEFPHAQSTCFADAMLAFAWCGEPPTPPNAVPSPGMPALPTRLSTVEVLKLFFKDFTGCPEEESREPMDRCQNTVDCLLRVGRHIERNPNVVRAYYACCTAGVSERDMYWCIYVIWARENQIML